MGELSIAALVENQLLGLRIKDREMVDIVVEMILAEHECPRCDNTACDRETYERCCHCGAEI